MPRDVRNDSVPYSVGLVSNSNRQLLSRAPLRSAVVVIAFSSVMNAGCQSSYPVVDDRPGYDELAKIGTAVISYARTTGRYPPSGNAGLLQALSASSPPSEPLGIPGKVSPQGELLDLWGNPYTFAVSSSPELPDDFILRSAGPNGVDEGGRGDDLQFYMQE